MYHPKGLIIYQIYKKEKIINRNSSKRQSDTSILFKLQNKVLIKQEKSIQAKIDLAFDARISKTLLAKKTNELEIQLNEILQKQSELENKDYSWLDKNQIKKFLLASMGNLENEDPQTKRKVIETFVHKIIIYVDRIEVTYKV